MRSIRAVSKLTNQWIEIFRAGDYGEQGSFSEADLDRVVANYQPEAGHEAPIVIGHPKDNAPAYGWIEAVKRVGSTLLAKPRDVDPVFSEMVESRKFPKRSASFYRTTDGKSIQGLRHVGFLGAMPPVVKGLADCKFADESAQEVFEFQESGMAQEESVPVSGLKAWLENFMEKFKPAATSFSEEDAKRIAAAAVTEAVTPLQQKLTATEAKFAERETKLSTSETEARGIAVVTGLKAKGRWVPAFEKAGLPLVFAELAKVTDTVEFGEGDEKKKVTPLELLAEFMESLPKIVPTAAVYEGTRTSAPATPNGVNAGRMTVDQNSVRLNEAALEFSEKNKVDFATAITEVLKKQPELGQPGGAAGGQV